MKRAWVNQPSTLQPHHNLHGTNVLVERETERVSRVWFTEGPIVSQQMQTVCLSPGWRP